MADGTRTPLDMKNQPALLARAFGWLQKHNFGVGFLGPGVPQQVLMQQAPEEEGKPRLMNYTVGRNTNSTPRGDEPNLKPFDMLRSIARNYDIASICIQYLQQEMQALDWKIAPLEQNDKLAAKRLSSNIKRVTEALTKPDGEKLLDVWVARLLGEDLEIGAPVIYKGKTKGGKKLGSLEIIEGDLIKPLIDFRGKTAGYQEIWQGVPIYLFDKDEIMYVPRMQRVGSVYGISPIERIIVSANIALRRQNSELAYFDESNMPAMIASLPENWTPEQIDGFMEWWDALVVGNEAQKHRIKFWPGDATKIKEIRQPNDSSTEPQLWLLRVTCAAYNVKPEEIGYTMHVNRASAQQQNEGQARVGVLPIAHWVEDIFTEIIQHDMGEPELRFMYDMGGHVDDRLVKAETDELNIKSGIYSPAYVRNRDGIELDESDPLLLVDTAPQPEAPAPVEDASPTEDVAPTPGQAPAASDAGGKAENVVELAAKVGRLQKSLADGARNNAAGGGKTIGAPASGGAIRPGAPAAKPASGVSKPAAAPAPASTPAPAQTSPSGNSAGKGGPGSRGGHYWIDAKGNVRYGPKPTHSRSGHKTTSSKAGAKSKASATHAARSAQAASQHNAQHAQAAAAHNARHAQAASQHNARHAQAAANHKAMATATQNARAQLKGAKSFKGLTSKGWKTKGAGHASKAQANSAANSAGAQDPTMIYAVVKVGSVYYVVAKMIQSLQTQTGTPAQGAAAGQGATGGQAQPKADPAEDNGAGGGTGQGKPLAQAASADDLRKWQSKALSRIRAGKSPACEFSSEHIKDQQRQRVSDALAKATSGAQVKAVFAAELQSEQE